MSITQLNAVCPAILVGLDELLKDGAPYNLFTPVGLLQSLYDPSNRKPNSVVQGADAANGHPKTVRIAHKQRAVPTDTGTAKTCDTATSKAYFEETFTVNQYRQHVINVKESDVRKLCDSHSALKGIGTFVNTEGVSYNKAVMAEIVAEIMMDFDSLRQAINTDLHTSLTLQYGKWVGGSDIKTFNVYRTTTTTGLQEGSPVLSGFNSLTQELSRSTLMGKPIVVGEGALDLAINSLNYGCCNSSGNDFGKMNTDSQFQFYRDFTIGTDSVGSANGVAIYMPGSLQFASYNEYVGPGFNRPIGVVERGTIPDPAVPGLSYDIRIIPNACSGTTVTESYDIIIGVHFDLYVAPTNQFQAGDRLSGVNGVFKATAGTL